MAFTTEVDQLARELESAKEQIRLLNATVNSLGSILNVSGGTINRLEAGRVILSPTGIDIIDPTAGSLTEDATINWKIAASSKTLGSIGSWYSTAGFATMNIYSNMDYRLQSHATSNASIELASKESSVSGGSSGSINSSFFTEAFVYINATATSINDAFEISNRRRTGVSTFLSTPFLVRDHYHSTADGTTLYSVLRLQVSKASAGNPGNPEEGYFYYNTIDNAIRMYADGGWRTLSSWA